MPAFSLNFGRGGYLTYLLAALRWATIFSSVSQIFDQVRTMPSPASAPNADFLIRAARETWTIDF
jgi:hypothetical protein